MLFFASHSVDERFDTSVTSVASVSRSATRSDASEWYKMSVYVVGMDHSDVEGSGKRANKEKHNHFLSNPSWQHFHGGRDTAFFT